MYTIKMEADKTLVTTIKSTIYRGELNANRILFLLPNEWEEHLMADYGVRLDYITPDGVGHSEMLVAEPDSYKEYLQYYVPVGCPITDEVGEVELWLSILDRDGTVTIKTGSNYLPVVERKVISDYYPAEKRELIDALAADVENLKLTKADNVVFHVEDGTLQLLSGDAPIGGLIHIRLKDETVGIADAVINDNGELVLTLSDGTVHNLGNVVGKDGAVYVPHVDDHKVLTFTLETEPTEPPAPTDLNPTDEWSGIDGSAVVTDYVWEHI